MKKVLIILSACCFLFFSTSNAVELIDSKDAPSGYVKVTEKDGKKMEMYGSTSVAYTPEQYHQIFKCYGLDLVNGDNAPKGYVKVSQDSEGKQVYNFGSAGFSYTPQEMNQLLEAYGLMINEDPQGTPRGYVKVSKDKDGKTIFIYGKGDALAYPPDVLNNLLAAYN